MHNGFISIDQKPETWSYWGHLHVRIRIRLTGVGYGAVDLSPRECRAFARNLDIAAEVAEDREKHRND